MAGKSLEESAAIAADFKREEIRLTLEDKGEHYYGVHFEQVIPLLVKRLEQ